MHRSIQLSNLSILRFHYIVSPKLAAILFDHILLCVRWFSFSILRTSQQMYCFDACYQSSAEVFYQKRSWLFLLMRCTRSSGRPHWRIFSVLSQRRGILILLTSASLPPVWATLKRIRRESSILLTTPVYSLVWATYWRISIVLRRQRRHLILPIQQDALARLGEQLVISQSNKWV